MEVFMAERANLVLNNKVIDGTAWGEKNELDVSDPEVTS